MTDGDTDLWIWFIFDWTFHGDFAPLRGGFNLYSESTLLALGDLTNPSLTTLASGL
jgi:hypothetical protein